MGHGEWQKFTYETITKRVCLLEIREHNKKPLRQRTFRSGAKRRRQHLMFVQAQVNIHLFKQLHPNTCTSVSLYILYVKHLVKQCVKHVVYVYFFRCCYCYCCCQLLRFCLRCVLFQKFSAGNIIMNNSNILTNCRRKIGNALKLNCFSCQRNDNGRCRRRRRRKKLLLKTFVVYNK